MTIDRRADYIERCNQCKSVCACDYAKRYQQGLAIKRALKIYWHLLEKGKQQ